MGVMSRMNSSKPAPVKETEEQLLNRISSLYSKLEDIREKKEEQETKARSSDSGPRVFVVSRRLPFVLARTGEGGSWRAEALTDAKEEASQHLMQVQSRRNCLWVGWPGTDVLPSEQSEVRDFLVKEHKYLPVFIDATRSAQYSSGFCDQILWPLFHSTTPTTEDMINNHHFEQPNDDDGFDADSGGWGWSANDSSRGSEWGPSLSGIGVGVGGNAEVATTSAVASLDGIFGNAAQREKDKGFLSSAGGSSLFGGQAHHFVGDDSSSMAPSAEGGGAAAGWSGAALWQAYCGVNQTFADAIREHMLADEDEDGGTGGGSDEETVVWINDLHLLLLPRMLRAQNLPPATKIGFFLHAPFPSSEHYRILPHREEILVGMLHADLLGFQTYDYARHFLSACESILFCDVSPMGVEYQDHFTEVCICPVGIDPDVVRETAGSKQGETARIAEKMTKQFHGRKVMLGVDSLNPTTGLVHKLLAIEELFRREPELAEGNVFVQIGLACKSDGRTIGALLRQINIIVTRINSMVRKALARVDTEDAIQYFTSGLLTQEHIYALFCVSHVLVVTPLRDGMNTLPFEYVVCRDSVGELATVVLSEFAGCARSLGGALLVNPWNTMEVADALGAALETFDDSHCLDRDTDLAFGNGGGGCDGGALNSGRLNGLTSSSLGASVLETLDNSTLHQTADQRHLQNQQNTDRFRQDPYKAHSTMLRYVTDFTSADWVERFLSRLQDTNRNHEGERLEERVELRPAMLQDSYARTCHRLIVINLEGVLCKPQALPELLEVSMVMINVLLSLSAPGSGNMVVIQSPRSSEAMDACLSEALVPGHNIALAAEYGMFVKWPAPMPGTFLPGDQGHLNASVASIGSGGGGGGGGSFDGGGSPAAAVGVEWECLSERSLDMSWIKDVMRLLEYFTERTPGSVIELKDSCVAWHYRDCDVGHGTWQAKQCMVSLVELAKRTKSVEVCIGEKNIEVRPSHCSPPNLLQVAIAHMEAAMETVLLREMKAAAAAKQQRSRAASVASLEDLSLHPVAYPVAAADLLPLQSPAESPPSPQGNSSHWYDGGDHKAMDDGDDGVDNETVSNTCDDGEEDLDFYEVDPALCCVDFVLFVASGDDLTDEDYFEAMAPPPFDLDEFITFANEAENVDDLKFDDDEEEEDDDDEDDADADEDYDKIDDTVGGERFRAPEGNQPPLVYPAANYARAVPMELSAAMGRSASSEDTLRRGSERDTSIQSDESAGLVSERLSFDSLLPQHHSMARSTSFGGSSFGGMSRSSSCNSLNLLTTSTTPTPPPDLSSLSFWGKETAAPVSMAQVETPLSHLSLPVSVATRVRAPKWSSSAAAAAQSRKKDAYARQAAELLTAQFAVSRRLSSKADNGGPVLQQNASSGTASAAAKNAFGGGGALTSGPVSSFDKVGFGAELGQGMPGTARSSSSDTSMVAAPTSSMTMPEKTGSYGGAKAGGGGVGGGQQKFAGAHSKSNVLAPPSTPDREKTKQAAASVLKSQLADLRSVRRLRSEPAMSAGGGGGVGGNPSTLLSPAAVASSVSSAAAVGVGNSLKLSSAIAEEGDWNGISGGSESGVATDVSSASNEMVSAPMVAGGGVGGAATGSGGNSGAMVPSVVRRSDILAHKKFAPRKDMPPSSMLIQAMKRKFGDQHGKHNPPKTPAECWALIHSVQQQQQESSTLSHEGVAGVGGSNVSKLKTQVALNDTHVSYRDGPYAVQPIDFDRDGGDHTNNNIGGGGGGMAKQQQQQGGGVQRRLVTTGPAPAVGWTHSNVNPGGNLPSAITAHPVGLLDSARSDSGSPNRRQFTAGKSSAAESANVADPKHAHASQGIQGGAAAARRPSQVGRAKAAEAKKAESALRQDKAQKLEHEIARRSTHLAGIRQISVTSTSSVASTVSSTIVSEGNNGGSSDDGYSSGSSGRSSVKSSGSSTTTTVVVASFSATGSVRTSAVDSLNRENESPSPPLSPLDPAISPPTSPPPTPHAALPGLANLQRLRPDVEAVARALDYATLAVEATPGGVEARGDGLATVAQENEARAEERRNIAASSQEVGGEAGVALSSFQETLPVTSRSRAGSEGRSSPPLVPGAQAGDAGSDQTQRTGVAAAATATLSGALPAPPPSQQQLRPSVLASQQTSRVFPLDSFGCIVGVKLSQAMYFFKTRAAVEEALCGLAKFEASRRFAV